MDGGMSGLYQNETWELTTLLPDLLYRRSLSGYCTFFGGNLVTWHSKKQRVVARSSAEA